MVSWPYGLLFSGLLLCKWSGRDVKLTTHLHLVSRLRMSMAVHPLFPICFHGLSRDKFTFSVPFVGECFMLINFFFRITKLKFCLRIKILCFLANSVHNVMRLLQNIYATYISMCVLHKVIYLSNHTTFRPAKCRHSILQYLVHQSYMFRSLMGSSSRIRFTKQN